MPEWSIGTVSKTVVPLRVPRVRIPVFPQIKQLKPLQIKSLRRFQFYAHTKIHTNCRRNLDTYKGGGIMKNQACESRCNGKSRGIIHVYSWGEALFRELDVFRLNSIRKQHCLEALLRGWNVLSSLNVAWWEVLTMPRMRFIRIPLIDHFGYIAV